MPNNSVSMWPGVTQNATDYLNNTRGQHHISPGEPAISIAIIVINISAILINSLVIIITVSVATLRKCASSCLVLYLCIFDILASCASLFHVRYIELLFLVHPAYCVVYKFLNGFFAYFVVGCILTFNIDMYHSIIFPMHYSSHVTKVSVLLSQAATLFISIVFSSIPVLFTNEVHVHSCLHIYSHELVNVPFSVVVLVVYFVVPTVCMTAMNISVYKVAKRSLAQISTAPTITCDAYYMQNNSPKKKAAIVNKKSLNNERTMSMVEMRDTNDNENTHEHFKNVSASKEKVNISTCHLNKNSRMCIADIGDVSSELPMVYDTLPKWMSMSRLSIHSSPVHNTSPMQMTPEKLVNCLAEDISLRKTSIQIKNENKGACIKEKTNYKAMRNLVIPFMYFVTIWGPYFSVHLLHVQEKLPGHVDKYYVFVGIMVYLSFALNPLVYVLTRKNYKEEAAELFRVCRRQPTTEVSVTELRMGQTFQQFLDASSNV